MSDFKVPENVSGRYVDRRNSANYGRGRSVNSGENSGKQSHRFRSLRPRNNSGSSAEGEPDNYHRNERLSVIYIPYGHDFFR
jgi:hypothetical protein